MTDAKPRGEPVPKETPDLLAEEIEQLRQIFPQAFTEGKIDFEKLGAALGDQADDRPERYSFSWAGKRDAIRLLQTPSRATLVPVKDESVNFDATENLFVEGDNLEVLKLLYKAYCGRVKMIYIDPPYNTGNDFVYPDNYADPLKTYLELTQQITSNPETGGRYHSAWLSMMYPRLFLARQLLREDGVIFVSIDDNEVHNLRMVMNEIFGEENFITTIIWQKVYAPKNTARHFSEDHDFVIVYARNGLTWRPTLLPRTPEADARYENPDNDPRGLWKPSDLTARNYYSQGRYEVTSPSGKKFKSGMGRYWRSSPEKFWELDRDNRIWWGPNGDNMPALKRFLSEVQQGIVPQTLWLYRDVGHTQDAKKELLDYVRFSETENVLNTVKPSRFLQKMLQLATKPRSADIVIDFFAGSAPLGHAVLKQNHEDGGNRRFVCVQFPEPLPRPEAILKTIADIGKERIRHVIAKMKKESAGKLDLKDREAPEDLGFKVFKLAESNYKQWNVQAGGSPDAYATQVGMFADSLVDGWKPENVIYEVAIKEGYGLNCRVESVASVKKNTVYLVTDPDKEQSFYICLDGKVRLDALKPLELKRDNLFVCRDRALDDDAAANLALQCRLKTL